MNVPDGPTARLYGLPLDHPLETEPDARMVEAVEMFRVGLLHVGLLGAWDGAISSWVRAKDAGTIASIAAWLRRAWQAGVVAGRREALDAGDDRAEIVAAIADDIRATCNHADTQLTDGESGAQEVLEYLLDELRRTVAMHATDSEDLERIAAKARRRYFAMLAGDLSTAQRLFAVNVAVDTARDTLLFDSELAAAVRAVVDADRQLDDAIGEVGDLPGHPVRSVVLPAADAATLCEALEVPEEGHRVQWAHRHDLLVDVRIGPSDYTNLQAADDDGPHLAEDGHLVVEGRRYEVTVGWPRGTRRADAQVDALRGYGAEDQDVDTAEHDAVLQPVLQPGTEIPDMPGFVVGVCGHRIAGSEWKAGFRTCERCPADEGHSTPLAAAGLAAGVLGVTGLVATHSGSPGAGLVLAAVGGVIGVVVLVLGRRGRDGGAS